MKSLKRPLPILLLAVLTACASERPSVSAVAPSAALASEPVAGSPPKVTLSPELLFGVLASEIAAQRGAGGSAAMTSLALAKQTRDPRLAERATQFAIQSGNLTMAAQALTFWLELDPDSVAARQQLMVILLREGRLEKSQPLIEDLLRRKPEDAASVFVQVARLTASQIDKPAAYRLVRHLAAGYPDLPEARFALLTVAAEAGDGAMVAQQFDRLATLAPKWDLPVAWEAERLRKQNLEAAIAFLKRELARRPDASLELKIAYPRLLVGARQFVAARQGFEALLAKYPRQPELLYSAGLLAFQLNDLDVARQELEGALAEHYPDADFLRYSLGQIAENQRDAVAAGNWYAQVGPGPQFLPAQVRLAFIEAQSGRFEAGIARIGKLGKTHAERVQLTLVQSEMAREAKKYAEAESLLTAALKQFPRAPELLYERAMIFELRNQPDAAERDLQLLLKIRPNDEQALNALGYVLATRTTRYAEAHAMIQKALKLAPENPMIIDSMGWVLYKQGKLDEALKYLERAYSVLPDQEVAAHYGEVLWRMGRKDEARELWQKALQNAVEHPQLDETMHRLQSQ